MFLGHHWEQHYDLSIQLYSLYAEAEYSICNFKEVGRVAGIIIQSAKSSQDKQRAYATLIKALGAENKLEDAIELVFCVLSQLDVHLPSTPPDKSIVMNDWMDMTRTLQK
eukprot:8282421-Ditylum_brightwellii.AAC.1